MATYQCPQCDCPWAIQDGRSRNFTCLKRDPPCDFSVSFEDYRRVSSALINRPYNPNDTTPPDIKYQFDNELVSSILRTIHLYQEQSS